MLTKADDIKSTLALVKGQLSKLKRSESVTKPEFIAATQKIRLKDTLKKIRKLTKSINKKVKRGQKRLKDTSGQNAKSEGKNEQNTN